MKVCGFSFIRNARKLGYPVLESIRSVLPVCDHFIIAVGNSDDDTLAYIRSLDSDKLEIIETIWDDNLREGGKVLAIETNKAFDAIGNDYDWCFYIQGDEVVHEKFHAEIRKEMECWKDDDEVDGLLFKYLHFWGTYDYVGNSRSWYRNEIRIIRNNKAIRSYLDAQGFRKNNEKLKVKPVDAYIYHYGWVKNPNTMMEKIKKMNMLWHGDDWLEKNIGNSETFDYSGIDSLSIFNDTHPEVMQALINERNWHFKLGSAKGNQSFKKRVLEFIESITGVRLFEYRNYKIIK